MQNRTAIKNSKYATPVKQTFALFYTLREELSISPVRICRLKYH